MSDQTELPAKDDPPRLLALGAKALLACLVGPVLTVVANHFFGTRIPDAPAGIAVWVVMIASIVGAAFLASLCVLLAGRGRLPASVSMALASFVIQLVAISSLARG